MNESRVNATDPVWHEGVETVGGVIVCPECGVPGVVVLSAAELVEHMSALGRVADVRAAYQRVPGGACWWCHACTCGGVMVLS